MIRPPLRSTLFPYTTLFRSALVTITPRTAPCGVKPTATSIGPWGGATPANGRAATARGRAPPPPPAAAPHAGGGKPGGSRDRAVGRIASDERQGAHAGGARLPAVEGEHAIVRTPVDE